MGSRYGRCFSSSRGKTPPCVWGAGVCSYTGRETQPWRMEAVRGEEVWRAEGSLTQRKQRWEEGALETGGPPHLERCAGDALAASAAQGRP